MHPDSGVAIEFLPIPWEVGYRNVSQPVKFDVLCIHV